MKFDLKIINKDTNRFTSNVLGGGFDILYVKELFEVVEVLKSKPFEKKDVCAWVYDYLWVTDKIPDDPQVEGSEYISFEMLVSGLGLEVYQVRSKILSQISSQYLEWVQRRYKRLFEWLINPTSSQPYMDLYEGRGLCRTEELDQLI